MTYTPPFTITTRILRLVAEISEAVGRRHSSHAAMSLALRRAHRIRTLRGSLAIEGNTLSEDEIRTLNYSHACAVAHRSLGS